ncbi:hypothetical protein [Paenibacillus pini]|uniref:Uncharacterized protein n=1 Tax=Paenibacillus pini JCM 16418 TaxID=1236976 RepID=W7YLD8_9BACL|nr:hypothetical protein [Paenibacillus pini]GAF08558.1 hypothetical protein JCM16418_2641 [Paenibacillus pini JCM 16418]
MYLESFDKYQMREQLEHYEGDHDLCAKALSWSELAQSHLNLAHLLLEEGLCKPSLIVAHMAVKAKLKQIYLQVAGMIPPEQWLFDDLVSHTREVTKINMETELFLNTLCFISEEDHLSFLDGMSQNHVVTMLQRLEEILASMNNQVMDMKVKVQLHM